MARTVFGSGDPGTVKKWSTKATVETFRKSYFTSRMMGTEEQSMPIVIVNELEQGPGDEVTVTMVGKIVGKPIQGEERAEGKSKRLSEYTDKVRIDRQRQPINLGHVMTQKRRAYDLKRIATTLVANYWSEYLDEEFFCQISGRRGTGTNIQHLPVGYTGFPITFSPPDANHLVYPGTLTAANQLTTSDTMGTAYIEGLTLLAETMIGGDKTKPFRMTEIDIEGGQYWVLVTHPCGMYDLRREVGDQGWLALEKARAAAIGSSSPIFKGKSGATAMLNQCILHQHNSITYQDDYGAGANVRGYRSLFMGAHAASIAFGSAERGQTAARVKLGETTEDHEADGVMTSQVVLGIKKSVYGGQDFGVISADHSASDAARAKQRS